MGKPGGAMRALILNAIVCQVRAIPLCRFATSPLLAGESISRIIVDFDDEGPLLSAPPLAERTHFLYLSGTEGFDIRQKTTSWITEITIKGRLLKQ